MTLDKFKKLEGKRVKIFNKTTNESVGGVLEWIGKNRFFNFFQFNINRCPFRFNSLDELVIEENEVKPIFNDKRK